MTTVPSPLSFTAVLTNEPLRTEHNLRRSVFEKIFDIFFVIIGNGELNHTGIKCRGGQNQRQQTVAGEIPETIRARVQTVHRVAKWKKMFFVFRGNSHCVFQWKSEKAETFFSLVHLFNVAGNNKTEPEHWYRELRKIEEHTKIRAKICLWNILSPFRDSRGLRPWTPPGLCPGPPRFPPSVLLPPSRPPPHASNN